MQKNQLLRANDFMTFPEKPRQLPGAGLGVFSDNYKHHSMRRQVQ
jgi:hypothetical protein